MKLATFGPVDAGQVKAAAKEALEALGAAPRLTVLYAPATADHAALLRELKSVSDVPLVGATTGGAGFTERGVTETGIVGGFIGGDVEVRHAVARDLGDNAGAKIHDAMQALGKSSMPHHALLSLMDAFACDGEALVESLRRSTPPHWPILGGTAGDGWTFQGTRVFADQEVLAGAAVLVYLGTRQRLALGVRHGWCAASEGAEFEVTKIEGNVLKELDGRPAVDVYREELRRLGLLDEGEDLVRQMARFEIGVRSVLGDELKIRAPLGIGEDGSITLASSLAKRDRVRVVVANPDDLIAAARALASRTVGQLPSAVTGQLVFDCAARQQLLKERYGEQVSAFLDGGRHPLLGFACYGEIARFSGAIEGFHNTTAVAAAW